MSYKGIVCDHCGKFLDFSCGTEAAVAVACLYCKGVVQVSHERIEELLPRKDLLYHLTISGELTMYYDDTHGEGAFDALTPDQQESIAYEVDRALGYSVDIGIALEEGINSAEDTDQTRDCDDCNNPYSTTLGESALYDLCPDCYEEFVKEGKISLP